MKHSLSSNLMYNVINQIVSIIVPLITGPYIARVLSAELIGSYSYASANSSYFVFLSCLGLGQYGMLQVAAKRNNKEQLSCVFWEISILKLLLSFLSISVYAGFFFLAENVLLRKLYMILTINILANAIDISWAFGGLEDFKSIAIRNILVRILTVTSILCLVKDQNDVLLYAFIMQFSTFIGAVSAFPIVKAYICWPGIKKLQILRHFRPALIYFIPGIVNVVFTSADKTMLGRMSNNYEVGIYEQANKIFALCNSILNSASNVFLARSTYRFYNDDIADSKNTIKKIISFSCFVIFPATFGVVAVSHDAIRLFCGAGYEKSALVLQALCMNLLFSTLGNYYAHQCLISRGRQADYNFTITACAVINVLLNMLLIPKYQSIGAAVASGLSATLIAVFLFYYGKDVLSMREFFCISRKYILAAVTMYLSISWIHMDQNAMTAIAIRVVVGVVVYVASLILFKDKFVCEIIEFFATKSFSWSRRIK